jgi:hypothetical protein
MKFMFLATAFSLFVIFILKSEPSVLYIALVWLVPVTLYFWYECITSINMILLKVENKLLPTQSPTKRN